MRIYRIANAHRPVWDGTGAAILGGRWNSPGRPVIYAAMTYAGAMLEILAHTNIGKIPPSHRCVAAEVPDALAFTRYTAENLPTAWDAVGGTSARAIGDAWLDAGKTAILIVPSVVAHLEDNVLVNPWHPDAAHIVVGTPEPVRWDGRLFQR